MASSVDKSIHPTRDTQYYFDDGNAIFLVENILFKPRITPHIKIHTSRLVPHSQVFADMFQLPKLSGEKDSSQIEGLSDRNPISIPQIKAGAFRHLLLFFYGLIVDPAYQALVTEIIDDKQRTTTTFTSYLNISSLAHRFCMPKIEKWALQQFRRVLASPKRLTELTWDHNELLDALAQVKVFNDPEMEHEVRNLIGCHLQVPQARGAFDFWFAALAKNRAPSPPLNGTLVSLYKNCALKTVDPALFGFVFCSILSEGYTSSIWADLTLEDRSKLLAAQVYLTPLPFSQIHLNWAAKHVEVSSAIPQEDHPI
ncbi:hypothetical protein FRC07_001959, partial [Ceratobasidium sp. 392]